MFITTKYAVVFIVVFGLTFGLAASADQLFVFSDDLSSVGNLNLSQTMATLGSGRAYITPGQNSSQVVSNVVGFASGNIVSAKVEPAAFLPSGSGIFYYVSNNNGSSWTQVNPGFYYSFEVMGNQLTWRAVITRQNASVEPYLDAITISYTVSDQSVPQSFSGYNGNGGGFSFGNSGSFGSVVATDINTWVCSTLSSLGLGCGNSVSSGYQPGTGSGSIFGGSSTQASNANTSSGNSVDSSALTATIYTAGKKQDGSDSVNLVRVKGQEEIYEIVGGKKHFIPTMDIFHDYGFQVEWIQDITQQQLDKFPRVKLMQVTGDKNKTYYFTEGEMIRLIPDKNVFSSYGDREEDIIIISKKEFNWYPQNQFVFLENPLNRDVYQLIDGGKSKRYLTPIAVKRMKIKSDEIAPINEPELSFYKTQKPIVM